MRGTRGPLAAVAVVGLLLLLRAPEPGEPHLLVVDLTRPALVNMPTPAATHAGLVRSLADALRSQLCLPLPDRILVRLFASRHAFRRGLIDHGRFAPERAADLAGYAIGVALPRTLLLLRAPDAMLSPFEWQRLIAHELSHVAQKELSGDEHRPPLWLEEGMAEWAAYRAVEPFAPGFFRARHATAWGAARPFLRASPTLDLVAAGAPDWFAALRHHEGALLAYRLAFALTDTLVTRVGFDRVIDYFRLFRESGDPEHNFERAFAMTPSNFARIVATTPDDDPTVSGGTRFRPGESPCRRT